ncbi:hypothetical protein THASP1DRAFT_25823 [Thamnocephalis sphaerospora]|uniref:F-box/LRR-repeat protein 15-like leucin rich repeat domain-containing protein n=1 Tax=Thamnocephalis sphaerospora TaxID=78915 RepID=A0A4P9XJ35_9FUNG|nr:hypothetical protein THASP1DRAFT_25823 [Thamnocephalis sphaerospora]|eukprot:RKP05726.1 hypothetical protein THASP1DRAFT_25823 [Thamnocephalis sphaerospora]
MSNSLLRLPAELQVCVFAYLGPADLTRLAHTAQGLSSSALVCLYANVSLKDERALQAFLSALGRCAPHRSNVHSLSLARLNVTSFGGIVDQLASPLQRILRLCERLTRLCLPRHAPTADIAIGALLEEAQTADFCHTLQVLDISGCAGLTSGLLPRMFSQLPRLTCVYALDTAVVNQFALMAAGMYLRRLSVLHLDASGDVTDDGLCAMANGCHALRSLRVLMPVGIAYTNKVTDRAIHELARHCPKLEDLVIVGQTRITDKSIKRLAAACPRLRWLELSDCWGVTLECAPTILQNCRRLVRLRLNTTDVLRAD